MSNDSDNNKAVLFGFSFLHHGPHTAFHGLAKALSDQIVIDVTPPLPRQTPHWIMWRFNWRWLAWSERRVRPYFKDPEPRVIHYFFPENTMRQAAQWKGKHHLVATCHQPAARLSGRERPVNPLFIESLKASDAIIVQCKSHIGEYQALFPDVKVGCIPLGVDTTFFHGRVEIPQERPRILTVGNWLRDYATWAKVVNTFAWKASAPEFTVVASANTIAEAKRHLSNDNLPVRFLCGISDEELRAEYEKATLFYLPLEDAMANDAILEALAMGKASVVTDLPATRDYLGDAAIYVAKNSADEAIAAIEGLLTHPDRARSMRMCARQRAEDLYAWDKIADQYRQVYRQVAEGTFQP